MSFGKSFLSAVLAIVVEALTRIGRRALKSRPMQGLAAAAFIAIFFFAAPFPVIIIAAGLIGFSVPVIGMIASCIGIWLGVRGFRRGRAARYPRSIVCGVTGISISVLSFVFWPYVMLSSSYH